MTDRWIVEAEEGEVAGTYRVHVTADAASAYLRGDIEGVDALYERIRLAIEAAPELVEALREVYDALPPNSFTERQAVEIVGAVRNIMATRQVHALINRVDRQG